MLKRLWQIFGPVICALVLVVVVIYAYPQGRKYSYEAEKRSAVTLTNENFKSRKNKTTALSDQNHRFVPYFGSSEWLRFDALHPAVLAEKYDRNYRPYFIGQRGSASLLSRSSRSSFSKSIFGNATNASRITKRYSCVRLVSAMVH